MVGRVDGVALARGPQRETVEHSLLRIQRTRTVAKPRAVLTRSPSSGRVKLAHALRLRLHEREPCARRHAAGEQPIRSRNHDHVLGILKTADEPEACGWGAIRRLRDERMRGHQRRTDHQQGKPSVLHNYSWTTRRYCRGISWRSVLAGARQRQRLFPNWCRGLDSD